MIVDGPTHCSPLRVHIVILNPICEALKGKDCYEPISVRDFAPVDRQERYAYIRQLERGLSVRCVMHDHKKFQIKHWQLSIYLENSGARHLGKCLS